MMTRLFAIVFGVLVLFGCAQAEAPKQETEIVSNKTYMIVTAKIHDRDAFLSGYAKTTGPLVIKYGGRYVMHGPGAKLLEGEWGDGASMLISEWPSREVVEAFWNSAEYAEAKKLRDGIADVQVLIIDAPKFTKD